VITTYSSSVIALLRYSETAGKGSKIAATAVEAARVAMRGELELVREVNNPFGLARQVVKPLDSEIRTSFFIPHTNETGYWWQGENARLASLATAARMVAVGCVATDPGFSARLERFASDQVDWIMGRNPFDVCMVHGRGRNNPFYGWYGLNAPGGVANGITSGVDDENDIAWLPEPWASDDAQRWRWSEQWMPHAAWLTMATLVRMN